MTPLAAGFGDIVYHLTDTSVICIGGGDKSALKVGVEFAQNFTSLLCHTDLQQGVAKLLHHYIRCMGGDNNGALSAHERPIGDL